ncbi:MAG: SRPBCC family protein [Flavobacteriia bacterium]|nr:SRPBCC family protein [Flavobacteriia bacterium]
MNTQIEGREVVINKKQEDVFNHLSVPANFKDIMPEDVKSFEAGDDWFIFELKGVPAVKMKVAELNAPNSIVLKSASDKLSFELVGNLEEAGDQTKARLNFRGDFNPMLKMMVTKPLTNFLGKLSDQLEKL